MTPSPQTPNGPQSPRPTACLITGASGFIGGHLAARLVNEGWRVRCLVRASSDTSRLAPLGVDLAIGDLQTHESLRPAMDGCDVVFHCGALVSDWATVPEITAVNVAGTHNALTAAAEASVKRFVHFSTTDVYGYRGHATIDESYEATRFSSWYAQSKRDAEQRVWQATRRGGPAVVVLRPATVYGPGSHEVIGEIARALRAGNMLLIDGGRPVAGLVYVENVVDAALLAAVHDAAPGQAFNVTDGLATTWREFTDDLAAGIGARKARWSLPFPVANTLALGLEHGYRGLRRTVRLNSRPLLSRQAVHVLGSHQRFSNEKIRTQLGWQPRTGYGDGLHRTLAWLSDSGSEPGIARRGGSI